MPDLTVTLNTEKLASAVATMLEHQMASHHGPVRDALSGAVQRAICEWLASEDLRGIITKLLPEMAEQVVREELGKRLRAVVAKQLKTMSADELVQLKLKLDRSQP
jgi:hypothetical protein